MEKQQRSALVKIALLAFGWPLALNHYYGTNSGTGFITMSLTWLALSSPVGIVIWLFLYTNALFKALREFEGVS
tara:strand:- start:230 stop:451 length:222 start_codon:yes stop_codon:yes gene_type:complete